MPPIHTYILGVHGDIFTLIYYTVQYLDWGHAVAQMVQALRYKPEGRVFDYRWCDWNFSLT